MDDAEMRDIPFGAFPENRSLVGVVPRLSPEAIAMLNDVMGQIVLKPAGIPVYQEIMSWLKTQTK